MKNTHFNYEYKNIISLSFFDTVLFYPDLIMYCIILFDIYESNTPKMNHKAINFLYLTMFK
jgi:hypothetical protein